jgi:hypothetical protein
MATRSRICLVVGATAGAAGIAVACGGGSGGSPGSGSDGGLDATMTMTEAGGAEAQSPAEAGSGGSTADAGDAGTPACAGPVVPSNAVVCVNISPEAIAFIDSDPRFDGKGLMNVSIFSNAYPATDASLAPAVNLPAGAGVGDAGPVLVDLSQPVPVVRFEVAATTAFVRAYFVDPPDASAGPQPGLWIGGLDLSHGIDNAPLLPISLTAGAATNVTVDLVALRALTLSVSRDPSVTPAGNGEGPLKAIVVNSTVLSDAGTYLFGAAQVPCANLSGDASVPVPGWVVGDGPYWTVAILDEFDAGGTFPAGGLFSLQVDGGFFIPSIDELSYAANAYQATGSATLTYLNPWDGGAEADTVSCP